MKVLYFKNLFSDLWKHKWIYLFIIFLFLGGFAFLGKSKTNGASFITEEEQKEIEEYDAKIAEYEKALEDIEAGLHEQIATVENLQDYVDNSIYMKMNPGAVQYVTTQLAIEYAEGTNAGNVNNSLVTFIKDGGLKESVEEPERLEVKYWGEVLSASISGNVLNITMMHYDREKAHEIIELIKKKLQEQVKVISAVQGDFTLTELDTSLFERSEAGIINAQNGNHNNLRSYLTAKADLENRVNTQKNSIESFRENNKPEAYDKAQSGSAGVKSLLKYLVFGGILGFAVCFGIVVFGYLVNDHLRSADALDGTSFNVIEKTNGKNKYCPEVARCIMDLKLLLEESGKESMSILCPETNEIIMKVAKDFSESCVKEGIQVNVATSIENSAEDLRSAVRAGACVIIAEAGKTTLKEMDALKKICDRYKITLLGTVVIE